MSTSLATTLALALLGLGALAYVTWPLLRRRGDALDPGGDDERISLEAEKERLDKPAILQGGATAAKLKLAADSPILDEIGRASCRERVFITV